MKYILIMSLLVSVNTFSQTLQAPIQQGDNISAKQIYNASFMIGDIKHSLLSETKFRELAGDCWVKMRGQTKITLADGVTEQDISATDYGQAMTVSALPNSEGRFLRDIGGANAPALAQTQEDAIRNLTGVVLDFTSNISRSEPSQGGVFYSSGTIEGYQTSVGESTNKSYPDKISMDASLQVPTTDTVTGENRPINMGVNLFIKVNHQCN